MPRWASNKCLLDETTIITIQCHCNMAISHIYIDNKHRKARLARQAMGGPLKFSSLVCMDLIYARTDLRTFSVESEISEYIVASYTVCSVPDKTPKSSEIHIKFNVTASCWTCRSLYQIPHDCIPAIDLIDQSISLDLNWRWLLIRPPALKQPYENTSQWNLDNIFIDLWS